jgi:hypothetical protein
VNPAVFTDENAAERSQYSRNRSEQEHCAQVDIAAHRMAARAGVESHEPETPSEVDAQTVAGSLPQRESDGVAQPELKRHTQSEHQQPEPEQTGLTHDPNCGNIGSASAQTEESDWWEVEV